MDPFPSNNFWKTSTPPVPLQSTLTIYSSLSLFSSPALHMCLSYAKSFFEFAEWYQHTGGLCLMVFLTGGTTEWFHLRRTVKKNVCHTWALLQGDGRGQGTRLPCFEYTEPSTERHVRIRYESRKGLKMCLKCCLMASSLLSCCGLDYFSNLSWQSQ